MLPEPQHEVEPGQGGTGFNLYSSIGFPVQTVEETLELAARAANEGVPIVAERGTYVRWSTDVGAELWAQTSRDGSLMGLHPHFSGVARMEVRLEGRVLYPEASALDGAFYAWANPRDGLDPENGDYPFVFGAPDYDLHRELELPAVAEVPLSAFAHDLEAFEDDEAYHASQGDEPLFAAESFIPSGLFLPGGEAINPPRAHASFSGRVLSTAPLTNPATGARFRWARVRTLGGEVDVVADPGVIRGTVVEGGVVHGSFWLSGRLLRIGEGQTRGFWGRLFHG